MGYYGKQIFWCDTIFLIIILFLCEREKNKEGEIALSGSTTTIHYCLLYILLPIQSLFILDLFAFLNIHTKKRFIRFGDSQIQFDSEYLRRMMICFVFLPLREDMIIWLFFVICTRCLNMKVRIYIYIYICTYGVI